jgi:serine/threonine protein kinase
LRHPNIVTFYGVHISHYGDIYIVTEYLSKGSLDKVLQNDHNIATIDLLQMYLILFKIITNKYRATNAASGMIYLTQQNIIHR